MFPFLSQGGSGGEVIVSDLATFEFEEISVFAFEFLEEEDFGQFDFEELQDFQFEFDESGEDV